MSHAVPTAIANGQVVLVRKGEVYGGFMLTAQSAKSEMAQFIWRYGTDATGGFDTSDPNVNWSAAPESVQERKGDLMIEFGPFEICWSGSLGDKSWIYYGKFPGDELAENDLAICVTEEHSFDTIRPRDAKWRYRRSPVDGLWMEHRMRDIYPAALILSLEYTLHSGTKCPGSAVMTIRGEVSLD